jgi:hypothetical protein
MKLGMMNYFVYGKAFQDLQLKFPKIKECKFKSGIVIVPQIQNL